MARLGLDDMVPSYPAYTVKDLDSTASGIESGDSILGDRESVVSNTRFIFDDICFDSKPYRHTVARVSAKKRNHHKRRDPGASPGSPALPATRETAAQADIAMSRKTPTPIPLTGVPAEEHEAVLMKLREAEALIRTLQGRTHQPGTVSSNNATVASRSQHPLRAEDRVDGPLQDMTTQTTEVKSTKQTHTDDDLPVTLTTNKSRRRTIRPVEDARDFLPVRNVVQNRPKATTKPDRKASSAINEPSTLSIESPMPARPTRSPGRSEPTLSQTEVEPLTEDFKKGGEKKPPIKVRVTLREKGKQQQIIITDLHNGTTKILDAGTRRKVKSANTFDTQIETAPTATGHAAHAATSLDPSRPQLAANSAEEHSLPHVVPTTPLRSQEARHGSPTISAHKQPSYTDPEGVKAHVLPELDVLKLQRAPAKLAIEDDARQMTHDGKQESHKVFQSVVAAAPPNPPLPLPINNGFPGFDIGRRKQIKERTATIARPHLGYNPDLSGMDIERAFNKFMENTTHDVCVLGMPTGPQSRKPLEAMLATEVEKAKKRSVFIRAFKGLKKPGNELATVEEILGRLLVEVKALQTDLQQD